MGNEAFTVACPHCGHAVSIPSGYHSTVVNCPICGEEFGIELPLPPEQSSASGLPTLPRESLPSGPLPGGALPTGPLSRPVQGNSSSRKLKIGSEARMPKLSEPRLSFLEVLFGFRGRMRRLTFFAVNYFVGIAGVLVLIALAALMSGLSAFTNPSSEIMKELTEGSVFMIGMVVVFILMLWVQIAAGVKRWHDRDKSGWWVLLRPIWLIALLASAFFTYKLFGLVAIDLPQPDSEATTSTVVRPQGMMIGLVLSLLIFLIAVLREWIETTFLGQEPGGGGRNAYGDSQRNATGATLGWIAIFFWFFTNVLGTLASLLQ
ncbi:MAG: DUF805 domain-containing protein [Verrucomicrobiota bacterium]